MNKKRIYKSYPQEFKEEAVALVVEQGCSVQKRHNHYVYGPISCTNGERKPKILSSVSRCQLMSEKC
jgi:hypothetical protein